MFFFSSRRRHTRCALVPGVQTCALPIYPVSFPHRFYLIDVRPEPGGQSCKERSAGGGRLGIGWPDDRRVENVGLKLEQEIIAGSASIDRPEERRVGKECDSPCSFWWSTCH